jgi:hypothetical protein
MNISQKKWRVAINAFFEFSKVWLLGDVAD